MPMPFFPAEPGRPRELTSAEWAALRVIWRRRGIVLAVAGLGVIGLALFLVARNWDELGATPWIGVTAAVLAALPGLLLVAAGAYVGPERPKGRPRRVGRLVGRVSVAGKPSKIYVGPVPVVIPAALDRHMPRLGEVADLEILPPLEDEPRTIIARHVISIDRGRVWIGDPGMTEGWIPAS